MSIREDFEALFNGQMSEEEGRTFLAGLYHKGESAEEISIASQVMRTHAIQLPVSTDLQDKLFDNCGTGGDKSGTFNISTTSSLLLSACGLYMAKHGNRSITSKSGSADMLEALGIRLDHEPEALVRMIEDTGFAFLFAQRFHPAMRQIMLIRKSLPHRTIFNILGPITNPAGVKRQLVGVFSYEFAPRMAEALKIAGSEEVMVVSSEEGLDELSIATATHAARLKDGTITQISLSPEEAGLSRASIEELKGGDGAENARIAYGILSGEIGGAKRDVVLLNAAAALLVAGKACDLKEGTEIAREALLSGRALERLNKIIAVSERL